MDWQAFYASELQGVWLLLVAPLAFLAFAAGPGRRQAEASAHPGTRFVWLYCLVFGVATCIDPLATGPLGRALGLPDAVKTGVQFAFVWLGDFRVFLLVFGLFGPGWGAWRRAAGWTCVVPVVAGILYFGVATRLVPDLESQFLWLGYEVAFFGVALWLRGALVPAEAPPEQRAFLRRALAYTAAYYALWAASDILILAGIDAGWALRVVPNQLYYAFWIPFAFFAFFGLVRGAASDRA